MCRIRVEGGSLREEEEEGGIVWNTLKRGGIENRGVETKIGEGRGGGWQAELRGGCLKKRGMESPYKLCKDFFEISYSELHRIRSKKLYERVNKMN